MRLLFKIVPQRVSAFLLAVSAWAFAAGIPAMASSLPPAGKTLVLIGQEESADYQDYVNGTGVAPAGPSYYWTFQYNTLNGDDPALVSYQSANYPCAYAELAVDWEANAGTAVATYEEGIASGQYDSNIDALASFLNSHPKTTFLVRLAYEVTPNIEANTNPTECCDSSTFDWAAYPKAFHYIRNRLTGVDGVANALFVFHTEVGYASAGLYPGDADVDLVGFSVWNMEVGLPADSWGATPYTIVSAGVTVSNPLKSDLDWLAANHPTKPLMICESAGVTPAIESTAGFTSFLTGYFNLIEHYDFRAFSYINLNWTAHGWSPPYGDSRVETTTYTGTDAVSVKGYWLSRISNSRYVNYTDCLTTPTPTGTATATPTASMTPSATASSTPSSTSGPASSPTPSNTPTPTFTPSSTPTGTATPTASLTASRTPSNTPTLTVTSTLSSTASQTPTASATSTRTPTATSSATSSFTPRSTASFTDSPARTVTPTASTTATPTSSPTLTASAAPSQTLTATATASSTGTWTATSTPVPPNTPTPSASPSPTPPGQAFTGPPYPNPISQGPVFFQVGGANDSTVDWTVFTATFRKIAEGSGQISGNQTFTWDLKDKFSMPVANGIYFLRVEIHGAATVEKMWKLLVLR